MTVWPQETAIENNANETLETRKRVIKAESENRSKLKTLKEVRVKQLQQTRDETMYRTSCMCVENNVNSLFRSQTFDDLGKYLSGRAHCAVVS